VVLHTGYTKKGSNDMLDLLTGDTSTFEATLRQIGFNGKGTYGGVPGSWFISSTHRSKALDAFITNNIECQTQKWMAKKPAAPKEEKGKEKEESFIPSPFSVSNSTTPPGPTIKTEVNTWGNRWEPNTEMVMVKNNNKWVVIGCQDQESEEKGITSLVPLEEYHINHCQAKGWTYDITLLDTLLSGEK